MVGHVTSCPVTSNGPSLQKHLAKDMASLPEAGPYQHRVIYAGAKYALCPHIPRKLVYIPAERAYTEEVRWGTERI